MIYLPPLLPEEELLLVLRVGVLGEEYVRDRTFVPELLLLEDDLVRVEVLFDLVRRVGAVVLVRELTFLSVRTDRSLDERVLVLVPAFIFLGFLIRSTEERLFLSFCEDRTFLSVVRTPSRLYVRLFLDCERAAFRS